MRFPPSGWQTSVPPPGRITPPACPKPPGSPSDPNPRRLLFCSCSAVSYWQSDRYWHVPSFPLIKKVIIRISFCVHAHYHFIKQFPEFIHVRFIGGRNEYRRTIVFSHPAAFEVL